MPLGDPFRRRIDAIQAFLDGTEATTLVVACPPDLGRMVRKLLLRMEEQPDNPHLMIGAAQPFTGYEPFFRGLADRLGRHVDRHRGALAEAGVVLPPPPPAGGRPEPDPRAWAEAVGGWLSGVAEALPASRIASTGVILDPPEVRDPEAFWWSVGALTHSISSKRAKLLVIDAGDPEHLSRAGDWIRGVERVDFAVRSEEIEGQIARDLENGGMGGADARRYRLLAGAFASSAGRFDEAEGHFRDALEACAQAGAGPEEAAVLHALGALYLRWDRHDEAAETLGQAANRCLEYDRTPLLGMVLNDLGVALHHLGEWEWAGRTFSAARKVFQALGHRPGEAHVLDSAARSLVAGGRIDDARGLWEEARHIYLSITAPHLSTIREGGLELVETQLGALEGSGGGGASGDGPRASGDQKR